MKIIDVIEKKKKGFELTEEEIKFFIDGIMNNSIEEYIPVIIIPARIKGDIIITVNAINNF